MTIRIRSTKAKSKSKDKTKILGLDSAVKDKPRSIPFVDVQLVEQESVRLGGELSPKDVYGTLFLNKNFVTYDYEEYYNNKWGTLGNAVLNKTEQSAQRRRPAQFFVSNEGLGTSKADSRNTSLQLIGNALMLSPTPLRQATTLLNTAPSGYGTPLTRSGNTLWKGAAAGNSTYVTNAWTDIASGTVTFEEMGENNKYLSGIRQLRRVFTGDTSRDKLWGHIQSGFSLRKNQPFCVGVKLFPANPVMLKAQDDFWASTDGWLSAGPSATSQGARDKDIGGLYAQDHRNKSAVEIHWGKKGSATDKQPSKMYVFILHEDGSFYVYQNTSADAGSDPSSDPVTRDTWATIGSGVVPASVMSQNVVFLTFIPVGNALCIYYTDQPTTADTQRGNFFVVTSNDGIFYDEAQMRVYSYLGDLNFAFFPIVFPESGTIMSPVIQTYFTLATPDPLLNLMYVGKFSNRCDESPITFPDPYDEDDRFGFLSDTTIVWGTTSLPPKSAGSNPDTMSAYTYFVRLQGNPVTAIPQDGRGAAVNKRDSLRWYSPMLYQTQVTLIPGDTTVEMKPDPKIKREDVLRVSITEGVEGSRCTITLNNRKEASQARADSSGWFSDTPKPSGGRYTYDGKNNFVGVKPVRVTISYDEKKLGLPDPAAGPAAAPPTPPTTAGRFRGYIVDRKYDRGPPDNQSTVTLECEDRSKRLRETIAVNLPIYDGWCHLAVMYHLAREAGFTDDDILLYQDVESSGVKVKLSDIMTGDILTRSSGCWHGHVEGFPTVPEPLEPLGPAYVHMTLPNTAWNESPNYMFQMGTSIWDCMQQVRAHSNWYLFCNNWGSLIYTPPQVIIRETDWKFVEVDPDLKFNEYQQGLNVEFGTADFRNAMMVFGLVPLRGENPSIPIWTPDVIIKRQKDWPANINDPGYVPWLRWMILRNPKWNDHDRNLEITEEVFRRVTRQRIAGAFGGWGQESLFPYDLVTLDESQAGETGINGEQMIISNIQHTLEAGKMWTAAYTTERYDREFFEFDPRM